MKPWDESEHPRDEQGRFAKFGSIVVGQGEPQEWEINHKPDNLPDNLPSTKRTVNPGKESIESAMYENRIKTEFHIEEVYISRIDKECAKDVYYGLKSMFSMFPQLDGYIKRLRYDQDLQELGQWNPFENEMLLGRTFADINAVKASYELGVKHKKFLKTTTYKGVAIHEFAHALDYFLSDNKGRYSNKIIERIYHEFNLTKDFVKKTASLGKKDSEFFAMFIQEYMEQKQNASVIAKRIFRIVKEDLKNDT